MEVLHVHVLATNETITLETAERPSLFCLDRVLQQGPPETGPSDPSVHETLLQMFEFTNAASKPAFKCEAAL